MVDVRTSDGAVPQGRAAGSSELRDQVIAQAPSVFVTLLSILVGLVLSDLVTEARARMHLWPLDLLALRSWGQLFANGTAAVSVWMVTVHIGIARKRVPQLSDTLGTFAPPLIILWANGFVGQALVWPYMYAASIYLITCVVAVTVMIRHLSAQPDGAAFKAMLRLTGPFWILYLGPPLYLIGGIVDMAGWLSPSLEAGLASGGGPASMMVVWPFFREWHDLVEASAR